MLTKINLCSVNFQLGTLTLKFLNGEQWKFCRIYLKNWGTYNHKGLRIVLPLWWSTFREGHHRISLMLISAVKTQLDVMALEGLMVWIHNTTYCQCKPDQSLPGLERLSQPVQKQKNTFIAFVHLYRRCMKTWHWRIWPYLTVSAFLWFFSYVEDVLRTDLDVNWKQVWYTYVNPKHIGHMLCWSAIA